MNIEKQKEFLLEIIGGKEPVPRVCKGFVSCEGYQCPFLEIQYYCENTGPECGKGTTTWKSRRRCFLLFMPRESNKATCTLSDFLEYAFRVAV